MKLEQLFNPKCLGMTFEEFKKYEKTQKSELAKLAYEFLGDEYNSKLDELILRLRYYSDCFEKCNHIQDEIYSFWGEFIEIYESLPFSANFFSFKCDLLTLAEVTNKSELSNDKKGRLDDNLINYFQNRINEEVIHRNFDTVLTEVVDWYYFRVDYFQSLGIGTTETELDFLHHLANKNKREFEKIKYELPSLFISFSNCVIWYYNHLPERKDKNYDSFKNSILLSKISVHRNLGEFEKMSDTIYNYYNSYSFSKFNKWFLDFFSGFGEKPFRILRLFITIHIAFDLLFLIPIFKFKGIDNNLSVIKKFIMLIYFNNTTIFTIGYGDISPNNLITMLSVSLLQILGFLTTGAFITLTLRKIFRF